MRSASLVGVVRVRGAVLSFFVCFENGKVCLFSLLCFG